MAESTRRWHRSRPLVRAARIGTYLASGLFVVWVILAVIVVVTSNPKAVPFLDMESTCGDTEFSCEALAGTLLPIFSLILASAVFLLHRFSRVHKPFVRRARERPREVVLTAGSIIGEVVGRDELCRVMIDDLRDRTTRRPHVVIGGVGTGKTALLVRLTELLARRGAVPVPVRLRDAQERLDFRELARLRFLAEAEASLLSDAEGEKVWRQLCKEDRVVVLADGLEEALIEGDVEKERDTLVRLAIRQASDTRLPLIIASRPHDPLRMMDTTVVELEPLSEEAALQYIQRQNPIEDEHRLDWIVETADVVETPLYLQITRNLHRLGLLEYVSPRQAQGRLDTRSVDRAELRLRLLDTWLDALVDGHFPAGLALSREERLATIEQLAALACVGLRQDRLYVKFEDLKGLPVEPGPEPAAAGGDKAGSQEPAYPTMIEELQRRLAALRRRPDVRLAASWGLRLGLVEARGDGVRFPHSIMQAYLGSRLIQHAMADEAYREHALKNPGRELLIALVLHSRARVQAVRPSAAAEVPIDTGTRDRPLRDLLWDAARTQRDVKALDLYAAALEIDSIDKAPAHQEIAAELERDWRQAWAREERTLEEAKVNLVRRLGEAARTIAEQRRTQAGLAGEAAATRPAYRALYRISELESSYPIRLAAAQEMGAGGDDAFGELADLLTIEIPLRPPEADGGDGHGEDEQELAERWWRTSITRAWLAPLLVGSVVDRQRDARSNLEQWLEFVDAGNQRPHPLRLSLEVALAQGFKHAANRRRRHPHSHQGARAYLAERARDMLRGSRFWFTRLTLVHALCLWSLPDEPGSRQAGGRRPVDHKAVVDHWLALPDDRPEHPFVVEARRLAVWALRTGQPERFIWIDESGIVARVGSQPANPASRRKHNLWIPPSTGWTALHPRTQQLVADVLLLLNLAERGEPPDRERRLRRTNQDRLPPCLTGNRSPLDATRTIGMAQASEPGSNCVPGCQFELCPYPPKGEQYYRAELSEAFCRRQQALVGRRGPRRPTAPWQETLPRDLRRFWTLMARRAQPAEVDLGDVQLRRGRLRRAPTAVTPVGRRASGR